jgi:hypothetical protein
MGRVAELDPDQLAALRWLRAAFGFVEVLEVREHEPDRDPAPDQAQQGELVDKQDQENGDFKA